MIRSVGRDVDGLRGDASDGRALKWHEYTPQPVVFLSADQKLRDAVRLGRGTEVVLFENSLRRHFWNETQIAVDVVSICVADKASFALQAPDR